MKGQKAGYWVGVLGSAQESGKSDLSETVWGN